MIISDKRKQKLEDIVNGINDSKGSSLKNKIKKSLYFLPAVYVVGTMPDEAQKWFCDKTNYGTPRTWTNLNACLVGLLGMGLETCFYLKLGKEGEGLIRNVGDWLHIAYETAAIGHYTVLGVLQSGVRLVYTNTGVFDGKGKGAWAVGKLSGLWNSPYFVKWAYKKLRKN